MYKVGLIKGRHELPNDIKGYIFEGDIKDPTDIETIEKVAMEFVATLTGTDGNIGVYVTGLTVALVAVIKACDKYGMGLELYHYDRETDLYNTQQVLGYRMACGFCGHIYAESGWFCPGCGAS